MKKRKAWSYGSYSTGVLALALLAGSFYVASGEALVQSSSFAAAAYAFVSGSPAILIGRDGGSPAGTILPGTNQPLAMYDVAPKNVSNWATLRYMSLKVSVAMQPASVFSLSSFSLVYNYCIPTGMKYGYGWTSNGCATTTLTPTSVEKTSAGYTLTFNNDIPIYPQQSWGTLTVYALPLYTYTAGITKARSSDAKVQVKITAGSGTGDQCPNWSLAYGYSGCVLRQAIINLQQPYGNVLTIQRPYGYGYLPFK